MGRLGFQQGVGNLDVVRLIELLPLDKTFTPRVAKPYRDDFKRLVDAVERRE